MASCQRLMVVECFKGVGMMREQYARIEALYCEFPEKCQISC